MDKLLERHVALFDSVIEGHRFAHGSVVVPRPSEGDDSCVCIVYANRYIHLRKKCHNLMGNLYFCCENPYQSVSYPNET